METGEALLLPVLLLEADRFARVACVPGTWMPSECSDSVLWRVL